MSMISTATQVLHGDLTADAYDRAVEAGRIAWDIETSGLEWAKERIGTCQIAVGDHVFIVVIEGERAPKYLASLLEDDSVQKVFHHAPFDLRFMAHRWSVRPANVACTKVASKILNPELENREHSLKPVLRRYLDVEISKEQQISDWLAPSLTQAQLDYAAADVAYLLRLHTVLVDSCRAAGFEDELVASYRYMPTRVLLDLRGVGDVFAY
jgi:ribonuclease D